VVPSKLHTTHHVDHPTPHAKFGYNRFKRGVAVHAQNLPLGIYFFPCTRLQVCTLDPQTPLMAQTKRPEAGHILHMVLIKILKIYPFYAPIFYARKQLLLSARLSHRNSVRPSVCLSVRLSVTDGSVKSGAS